MHYIKQTFAEQRNPDPAVNMYQTPYLFNGKELDEETSLYYYGARYMQPLLSMWLSPDPLADKYPNVNPYAYCLQNPVKFVDPDGRDIELKFHKGSNGESSAKAFTKTINDGLSGQFEAYYTKGNNGGFLLNLRATKGGGDFNKMSAESKAFYTELYNITTDHNTTAQVDVKYGSSDVVIGNYKNNAIDIADINQFDDMGNGSATKQGKLTHELVEQFGKAQLEYKKGEMSGYNINHQKGINSENNVNGSIRSTQEKVISRGTYQQKFTNKNGSVSFYNINTNKSLIKVSKTIIE